VQSKVEEVLRGKNAVALPLPAGQWTAYYEQFDAPQANMVGLYRNIVLKHTAISEGVGQCNRRGPRLTQSFGPLGLRRRHVLESASFLREQPVNQAERPNEPGPSDNALELVQQYQEAVQAGRMEDAEAAAWNLLAMMGQQAATRPDPEMLLLTEASNHEAAADWQGAEVAYRKVLARAVATGEVTSQYRAYVGLSGLFQLVGDHTTAIEQAHSATAAARQAGLPILVAMALEQQAACALRLNQLSDASLAVEEALRCMADEKIYDVQRGRCLILRAECNLKLGSNAAAASDLDAAWQLLEVQSAMQWAAGVHSALARWWSAKAGLQARQGDWNGAIQAWNNAVTCRRYVAGLPHATGPYAQNALAETLAASGQALVAAGNREAAERLLAESYAIRQRIGVL
jgi:hypothetical protein